MVMATERRDRLLVAMTAQVPHLSGLEQICHGAVANLDVSGAALILMSEAEAGHVVVASGPDMLAVEDLQFALGEGPCLHSFVNGTMVAEPDLLDPAPSRWPLFASGAVAAGARAVFAVPLELGAIRLGVFYLYRATPGPLSRNQLSDAYALAGIATVRLLEQQLGSEPDNLGVSLRGDWGHRAIAHQATGMVSAQLGSTLIDALARLRAHALSHEASIYDVSVDVVTRRLRFDL